MADDELQFSPSIERPLIYIIDDEPDLARLMGEQLARAMECDVRPFESVEKMFADEEIERADLFVIDVNLADGVSGFDVCLDLPAECRFSAVLFVSGCPVENGDFKRAAALPFFDFIQKPFGTDVFIHRVNQLLQARISVPPDIEGTLARTSHLPVFVAVVLDDAFMVAFCNQRLAELVGRRHPGELVGRHWSEFVPEEVSYTLRRIHERVLRGDIEEFGEYVSAVKDIDGNIKNVRWMNSPFEGADNKTYTLSIGISAEYKRSIHRQFRTQFREMIVKHRAAIRAYKRSVTMVSAEPPENTCRSAL